MTKNQVIDEIQGGLDEQGIEVSKKQVEAVLDDFFGLVIDRAKNGEETSWPTIGKFVGARQNARDGVNPATGQRLVTPAKRVLKLRTSAKAKRQVNSEE